MKQLLLEINKNKALKRLNKLVIQTYNIVIQVFLVDTESALLEALVKYTLSQLYRHAFFW